MNTTLQLIVYTIPSLLVLIACVFLVDRFLKREVKQQKHELSQSRQRLVTPLRLQAYERMMLLLERINPENLIQRSINTSMNSLTLHTTLLQSVRAEFEHNLSQQIYVSEQCWLSVVFAKDELIALFNKCAIQTDPQKPAMQLGEDILNTYLNLPTNPLKQARNTLKAEVKELF